MCLPKANCQMKDIGFKQRKAIAIKRAKSIQLQYCCGVVIASRIVYDLPQFDWYHQ